jgi:ribonuclease P protein component
VVYAAKRREPEPVVGFVVSKAVGNSVTRHHVTRRLRAVMAGNMALVPAGTGVVVRALPGAARSTYAELEAQVSGSLARLVGEPR